MPVTIYSGISGNPGEIDIAAGTTQRARPVAAALPGRGNCQNQDLTDSWEDVVLADVSVAHEHGIWLRNTAAAGAATNYVEVAVMSDGSTTTPFARIRPGYTFGPVEMMPQTTGYPKLRVRVNTGTGRVETKIVELGDPATAAS
jgi:hypothetical protein